MGRKGKPSDHNTSHGYRLTAIPLTRYPVIRMRLKWFSKCIPISMEDSCLLSKSADYCYKPDSPYQSIRYPSAQYDLAIIVEMRGEILGYRCDMRERHVGSPLDLDQAASRIVQRYVDER